MRLFPVESEAVDKRSLPVDEVNGLMEVERERAKERLKTSSGGANPRPVERIPQAGKARDIVGEKLGVSGEMVIPKRRLVRCLG